MCIIYPFKHFNGAVLDWISNFIPYFAWRMIINHAGIKADPCFFKEAPICKTRVRTHRNIPKEIHQYHAADVLALGVVCEGVSSYMGNYPNDPQLVNLQMVPRFSITITFFTSEAI